MQKQIEQTITTVEIADMMEVSHYSILEKLEGTRKSDGTVKQIGIIPVLTNQKILVSDYFVLASYKDASGKENKCYKDTRMGCEFLVNKFTGEKGILFTAKYVKRFHDMEEVIKEGIPEKKHKVDKTEIMLLDARTRQANMYYKLAQVDTLSPTYKSIFVSKAAETLSGESIIPLPKIERKTYSAKEIGDKFGVSANKIGRIANKYNLKTEEYGSYYRDKKKNSDGECDTWRYYDTVIPVTAKFLQEVA